MLLGVWVDAGQCQRLGLAVAKLYVCWPTHAVWEALCPPFRVPASSIAAGSFTVMEVDADVDTARCAGSPEMGGLKHAPLSMPLTSLGRNIHCLYIVTYCALLDG